MLPQRGPPEFRSSKPRSDLPRVTCTQRFVPLTSSPPARPSAFGAVSAEDDPAGDGERPELCSSSDESLSHSNSSAARQALAQKDKSKTYSNLLNPNAGSRLRALSVGAPAKRQLKTARRLPLLVRLSFAHNSCVLSQRASVLASANGLAHIYHCVTGLLGRRGEADRMSRVVNTTNDEIWIDKPIHYCYEVNPEVSHRGAADLKKHSGPGYVSAGLLGKPGSCGV